LLEDCKTSRKKNKGVTGLWLLSEKSNVSQHFFA